MGLLSHLAPATRSLKEIENGVGWGGSVCPSIHSTGCCYVPTGYQALLIHGTGIQTVLSPCYTVLGRGRRSDGKQVN